jgi:hypothetical protein
MLCTQAAITVRFRVLVDSGQGASYANKLVEAVNSGSLTSAVKKNGLDVAVALTAVPSVLNSAGEEQTLQQLEESSSAWGTVIIVLIAVGSGIGGICVIAGIVGCCWWRIRSSAASRAKRKVSHLDDVDPLSDDPEAANKVRNKRERL